MEEKNTLRRENDRIDVIALWRKARKKWYVFAASLLVCILLVFCYLKIVDSKYEISAEILIVEEDNGGGMAVMMTQGFSLDGLLGGGSGVNNEMLILSSHTLMRNVVKQLELNKTYKAKTGFLQKKTYYKNSPLVVNIPESMADTLTQSFTVKVDVNKDGNRIKVQLKQGLFTTLIEQEATSFPINVAYSEGIVIDTTSFYTKGEELNFIASVSGYENMTEYLENNVYVELTEKKSSGISLSIEDSNIQRGKDILNTLIACYEVETGLNKNIKANNMLTFINDRLTLVEQDLDESEHLLEQYKRANDLSDIATEAQIILEANHQYRKNLLEAETQYSIISMVDSFLNRPENKYSLVPVTTGLPDKGAAEAINDYNKLLLERMRLLRTATDSNAALRALTAQIDAMRENILNTVSKAKESSNIAREDLREQEESFRNRLRGFPEQERAYLDLKRDQQIKNELYIFLMQRREESILTLASAQSQCRIINSAYSSIKPVSPNKLMLLALALALGLILPIIYLYGKKILSNKIEDKRDIRRVTQLPIVGDIYHNYSDSPVVVSGESATAEAFRLLRTNLQLALTERGTGVLMVTSFEKEAGKTFVAVNLATAMAMMGRRTLLVDLNFRTPSVAKYIGISSTDGAADYLSGKVNDEAALAQSTSLSTNLDVLLAGQTSVNPSDLLLSNRLEELIDALKKRYECIVLDTASIDRFADTFSLTRLTDSTLLVCRANHTTQSNLSAIEDSVADGLLKNVLLIVNDTEEESNREDC